jgi:hypothetical protein
MHELAERTMAGHLINLGFLQGTVEQVKPHLSSARDVVFLIGL